MRIDYTDRLKETKLIPGVNAKWFEGLTLEEVIEKAKSESVDESLFMVKDTYDKNGNGAVDRADYANLSRHADQAESLLGLTVTPEQLNALHSDYELNKTKIHTHENKSILDELKDVQGKLSYKGLVFGDLTSVSSHIIPATTKTFDIGSPTNRFRAIYVDEVYMSTNTLYIGDTPVMGTEQDTIVIKADPDQSVLMRTYGIGDSKICSDNNVEIKSTGIGTHIDIKTEGQSSRINMVSTSQINMEAPNINFSGNVLFTTAQMNDLIIKGNLTVEGTNTVVNSTNLTVSDNIIEINKGQTGNGVSLGEAGLKVDRGDLDAYFILFDEADDLLKAGTRSTLKPVATRDWVSEQISGLTGDMSKALYDTNNNGIVDKAEALHGCKLTPSQINGFYDEVKGYIATTDATLAENDLSIKAFEKITTTHTSDISSINTKIADYYTVKSKAHTHTNKSIVDQLSETSEGQLLYKGKEIISSLAKGDMTKAVYDTDNDGIVDTAKALHGLTTTINYLNSLPNKITSIDQAITELQNNSGGGSEGGGSGNTGNATIIKANTYAELPSVSTENALYVVMADETTTKGIVLYLGVAGGYTNLYQDIPTGSGSGDGGSSGGDGSITPDPTPSSGDMLKSVYDKNKNNIVDVAETLQGLNLSVAQLNALKTTIDNLQSIINGTVLPKITELNTAVNALTTSQHVHGNKAVIDRFKEINGQLFYNEMNITTPEMNLEGVGDMLKSAYDTNNDGIVNKADQATTLTGLQASITELNYLQGAKSNIQEQIAALTVGYQIKGTVATHAALIALDTSTITIGDAYIVEIDETKDNQKTNYVRGTNDWIYLGVFEVNMRDFSTNPINLSTESTGVLADSRIDSNIARKSDLHSHTVTDEQIKDVISKKHIHENISLLNTIRENISGQLFIGDHLVSCQVMFYNDKEELPTIGAEKILYVILKDVTNSNNTTFYIYYQNAYHRVLNDYIEGSGTGGDTNGILNQITKLNVTAPKAFNITIKETKDFNLPDINVLKFIPGESNALKTICDFDNGDKTDFETNDYIDFNGTACLKTTYQCEAPIKAHEDKFIQEFTIDKSKLQIAQIGVNQ